MAKEGKGAVQACNDCGFMGRPLVYYSGTVLTRPRSNLIFLHTLGKGSGYGSGKCRSGATCKMAAAKDRRVRLRSPTPDPTDHPGPPGRSPLHFDGDIKRTSSGLQSMRRCRTFGHRPDHHEAPHRQRSAPYSDVIIRIARGANQGAARLGVEPNVGPIPDPLVCDWVY